MKVLLTALFSVFLLSACATDQEITFDFGDRQPDLADDDADGVVNERDLCGGTSPGVRVSHDGCAFWEEVAEVKEAIVLFDLASDQVRVEHVEDIKSIIEYVSSHPEATILVEGHTSAIGDEEFNMKLQKRRAASVQELLIQEGAAPDKIRIHDQGKVSVRLTDSDSPVADEVNQRVYIRAVRAEQSMQQKWTIYSSDKPEE